MTAVTGPAVRRIDRQIADLRAVLERTTASLIELDADVTRQLLETSTSLRGVTEQAWADASRRHAELWRSQLALEHLLTQLAHERGTRRSPGQAALLRVEQLLEGASVEVPRSTEAGRPSLTEGPAPTVKITLEEALAQMSEDYDIIVARVGAVADVWGERTERLHELAATVSELQARVEESGVRCPNELMSIAEAIGGATMTAREDPLAMGLDEVPELHRRVERVRASVEASVRVRQGRADDLAATDASIGAGLEAVEACRAQLAREAERVVVPDSTLATLDRLAGELEQVRGDADLARQPGSELPLLALRSRSESLLHEVTRMAATEGGGLAKRDELRGLLGAYQAKAQALGLAESLELDQLYSSARDVLYSAPCDLAAAEQCVQEFQRAIRPRPMEAS